VLSQLKAEVRSHVFKALDDPTEDRPPVSRENVIINELIQEYLEFNRYKYAASVLRAGEALLGEGAIRGLWAICTIQVCL